MEKKTDENLSHNLSTLPNELLHLCIEKAFYIGVAATSVPKDQRRQFFRNIILVNLTWFKAIEQLHRKTDSNKKTTHGIYQSRIRLKDIDAIHKLKAMLEKAKAQQAQLEELLRFKENERRLMETELKATDVQNMLLEANRNIKRLELELIHMRNEVEVDTKQLIEVKETANLEKDFKVMFEVAHAENITLKEETGIKDKEILQLKERAVSAEELTEQLRQQLNCCKDEALHQKQLLDRTFSENEKLHNEKKQLTDENELLKCEINQLKEQVSLQLKMIEEQKDDSGKSLERTTEGSESDDGPSGYPTDIFAEKVDDKYLCTRCRHILKNPIQSYCGHRFCKDCFDHLTRGDGGQAICQRCSEEGEDAAENAMELSKTFPDNAIRREMNSMRVGCIFENCKWSGSFKEYEEHFENCEWCPRKCDTCGKKISRNQFDAHNCRFSTLRGGQECKFQCGKPVIGLDLELHLRQLLPEHFEALFRRMEDVTSFVSSFTVPPGRQGTLFDWMATIENMAKSFENKMQRQIERPTAKETESSISKSQIHDRGTVESSGATPVVTGGAAGGATGGAIGGSSTALTQTPQANDAIDQKLAKLSAEVMLCEGLLTTLDREVEHDVKVIETLQENERSLKTSIDSVAHAQKSIDRALSLRNVGLADLDKRVSDLEQTSYDGSLLWQLTDFQRRRQEAIAGRTTSIYSPPFYTSKTGYKMCARLYLNGDGMGKGTHVSLFFVIMRGQYDALLKWPFRQKVTLMFLDQSEKAQHVMDAFRPDPNSSSFKRPTTEMNIASGCPLFMALTQLDHPLYSFVKDDTAFVKIDISRE